MAVLIVYESSVDGKNRKSLRRLIQGTAPPEMKLFSKKQKGSCAGSYYESGKSEKSIDYCYC